MIIFLSKKDSSLLYILALVCVCICTYVCVCVLDVANPYVTCCVATSLISSLYSWELEYL